MTKIVSSSIIVVALLFAGCGKKEHKEAAAEASEHVEKAVDSAKEKADEVISEAKESAKEKVSESVTAVKESIASKSKHIEPEDQEMKPLKLAGDEVKTEQKEEAPQAKEETETPKESAKPAKEEAPKAEAKKEEKSQSAKAPKVAVTKEEIKVQEVKILNAEDELKRATLYKEIMEMRAKLSAERKALAEKELEYVKLRNKAQ